MDPVGNFIFYENTTGRRKLRFEKTNRTIYWANTDNAPPKAFPDCGFAGICPTDGPTGDPSREYSKFVI